MSADKQLVVEPAGARALRGRLRAPGDKSIPHRALLIAARATGRSRIRGLSNGDDVRHTLEAVVALGAGAESAPGELFIDGGAQYLHEPGAVIDVGNSGTGIRLLAGFVAAIDGLTVLQGDASIARRPMDRVVVPLRAMGARLDGRQGGSLPPLVVRGGRLRGTDYTLPVPSAQVKSAVLFAGLGAEGITTVHEPVPTRAHTEEMLAAAGADIEVGHADGGSRMVLRPSALHAGDIEVPADPSQAAFWAVAACITPGSDLLLEDVYVGRGRAGFIDVLLRMGAHIELVNPDPLRHTADVHVSSGPLVATTVGGAEVASLIDEIPVLCVAAAFAEGTTTFSGAAELRVKETDRVVATVELLQSLGGRAEPAPDGLVVSGGGGEPLSAGVVESYGDHRIAMAGAVAALRASGPVTIGGWDATATSYPGFEEDLLLVPSLSEAERRVVAIDGPAGSGKSTVAKAVATRLGIDYLDTGAMYRAVAFTAMRRGVDPDDTETVAKLAADITLEVSGRVFVDGVDATIEVRSPEVTRAVSAVAANPEVRKELVRRQREWAVDHDGGVVEGRDIGTVVFPGAPVKVYMTASDEERAQRRSQELLDMHYDEVAADIARRDHVDSTRQHAPLAAAPDAVVVDTTTSTVDQVVELVLELAAKAGLG